MNSKCGIVGLPNVGKSTLFSVITNSDVEIANYPFCTIEPNVGIVSVNDERLYKLSEIIKPKKIVPAVTEFVDIAGLVKGASKGEGLGNKFLSNIKEVSVIAHVVRCFEDKDIINTSSSVNPEEDIKTINTELMLSDLEILTKRYEKDLKASRLQKGVFHIDTYKKAIDILSSGSPLLSCTWSDEEKEVLKPLCLITLKKVIYVANVDEESCVSGNKYSEVVKKIAAENNSECVVLSARLLKQISEIQDEAEKKELKEMYNITESPLDMLVKTSYKTLGYKTYFTAGEDENRAWTFSDGMNAKECAGLIHTDFEKGFIKAEIYKVSDLFELKSEAEIKKHGLLRQEGKDYKMQDGDVVFFKFNNTK